MRPRIEPATSRFRSGRSTTCAIGAGSLGQLTLGWDASAQKFTVKEVKSEIERLENFGALVELSWTPGHADITGNEQADRLAKAAK